MKKMFVLFLSIMLNLTLLSQNFSSENFVVETVDEFGDKTGMFKVGIQAKGNFSNTATSQSCAELVLSFMESNSWYSLYEYCGNKSSDNRFIISFIGTTSNDVVVCGSKFSSSVPYSFIEMCEKNDTIKVKMQEITEYGTPTTAVFKLFNCKSFYNLYINQFGESYYVTYYKSGDDLYIYSKKQGIRYGRNMYDDEFCLKFWICMGEKSLYGNGRFANGASLKGGKDHNHIIYVDNIPIKSKYRNNHYSPDFDYFIKKIHIGAIITAKYNDDPTIQESFILSEEQYNEIIKFDKEH